MEQVMTILQMGGYGIYVWPSYAVVAILLGLQLFLPWKQWRQIRRRQNTDSRE